MRAFLVALEVERFEVEKVYTTLPLHCTLMPWFYTTHSASMIQRVCGEALDDLPPVEILALEPELFGAAHSIPVHSVFSSGLLMETHALLLERLTMFSVTHAEPQYVGAGYQPHVTSTIKKEFETGSKTVVRCISVVEALNVQQLKDKKVLQRIHLSNSM